MEPRHTLCMSTNARDWNATHYVVLGGDALVHAPEDGWPDDVALSLTDAPEAVLSWATHGAFQSATDHAAFQSAMSSDAELAVAWDDFRIEPWVGTMVLPAGKRLRYRSERPGMGLRAECHVQTAHQKGG